MPRKPRQFEIGKIYHVINRGVEKRKIFLKLQDYSRFILGLEFFNSEDYFHLWDMLARPRASRAGSDPALAQRIGLIREKPRERIVDMLGFTLMPNHYHLILREATENGISRFMKKLGGYSTYFNKQYNRVGPLFQSRYKSVPVQDDIQLHTIFAYVHTNPVELTEPGWKERKIKDSVDALEKLEEYKWSSYRDYINIPTFPTTTQREFFLNFFGNAQKCKEAIKDWISWKANKTEIDLNMTE